MLLEELRIEPVGELRGEHAHSCASHYVVHPVAVVVDAQISHAGSERIARIAYPRLRSAILLPEKLGAHERDGAVTRREGVVVGAVGTMLLERQLRRFRDGNHRNSRHAEHYGAVEKAVLRLHAADIQGVDRCCGRKPQIVVYAHLLAFLVRELLLRPLAKLLAPRCLHAEGAAKGSHAGHNPFGRAHTVGRVVVFGNGDVLAARHYLSRCGGCAHAEHSVGVATRCHSLCVGRQNSGRIAFYNHVLRLRSRRSEHSEADQ